MKKLTNIKDRYEIVPQMRSYDQISCVYKPYIMFFNSLNFKSKYVNTDELGFRLNYFKNNLVELNNFYNKPDVSIVIGGSTVFGFGATSDEKTISSLLTKKTDKIYLNFGATAFNSKQEILLFLNFFNKFLSINKVIIISGANDLYLSLIYDDDVWGNFFFKDKYSKIHDNYRNRNNMFHIIKKMYSKFFDNKENDEIIRNVNFEKLYKTYDQNLKLWKNLSISYNFKLNYFLQPLATWTKKKFSKEEKNLFKILDNSSDYAHLMLKEISRIENYYKYLKLLESATNSNKIDFVDLNSEIFKSNNLEQTLFVDRVHMNDDGYEEVSKIVLNNI